MSASDTSQRTRLTAPLAILALLTALFTGFYGPTVDAAHAAQPSFATSSSKPAKPSQSSAPSPTAGPVGRNGVTQDTLLRIAHTLTATVPPTTYADVVLDTGAGMVDLYLTDTSGAARDHALASMTAAQAQLVRVYSAPRTHVVVDRDLTRAGNTVTDLIKAHVPVQSYGPDYVSGVIQVTLLNPLSGQLQAATQAFGSLPVQITGTSAAYAQFSLPEGARPVATGSVDPGALSDCTGLVNRACDNSPWHGGDFIYDENSVDHLHADCSSSWPISLGARDYILTAGHCDSAGETWMNGSFIQNFGSGLTIGVGSQNLGPRIDVQLLSAASVQPSVWTGSYPTDTATPIVGVADAVDGMKFCTGGAFDGQVCDVEVSSYNQCHVNEAGQNVCGLVRATVPGETGDVLDGPGDSGGPVYVPSGSGVTALGVIEGGFNDQYCKVYTNRNFTPDGKEFKACSDVVFFTGLTTILANYPGASLIQQPSAPVGQPTCQNTVQPANSAGMIDFYHGTSLEYAQAIVQSGINPSLGSGDTDFGAGFYITTDENQAVQWANSPTNGYVNPTVMHYRIPAAVLTSLVSCGRVFEENGKVAPTTDFLNFVRTMRTTKPNPGGASYDFVEGPLLLNPKAFLGGSPPLTDGQQDAIFAAPHNLAAVFDAGFIGIAPAGSNASWIVGHAQHAGDDYPYETVGQFGHQNEGTDAWNEYYGQCDSFAAWKVYENLSTAPQHPTTAVPAVGWKPGDASVSAVNQFAAWAPGAGPGGNADVWSTQAQNWGATVDNTPTPGAIAWWPNAVTDPQDGNPPDPVHGIPGSSTGHVGYVTDVYPDGSITVEGYNMRENGEYSVVHMNYNTGYTDNSFGLANFNIPWPGGFIHLGDGPAPGVPSPPEPAPGVVQATYPTQVTVLGPGDGRGDFTVTGNAYPGTTHGWYTDAGHGEIGQELWTNTHPGPSDSTATWSPHLTASRCYEVDAFVPDQWSNSDAALYIVADQQFGSSLVPVNENDTTDDWVPLGIFQAQSSNGTLPVTLTDQGPGTGQIAADAMRYIPQATCSGLVRTSQTIDYSNGTTLGGQPYPGTINGWYSSSPNGQIGNQYYTYTNGPIPSGSAAWTALMIPNACYELYAYVPGNHANDYQALYKIYSAGSGNPIVSVDENAYTNAFAGLGTYRASASGQLTVILTDQSLANGDAFVSADTMSFVHTTCPQTVLGAGYPALTEGPGSPLSQFSLTSDWYNRFEHGDLGYEKWTNTNGTNTPVSTATWTFTALPTGTNYDVCAYIPDNYANNTAAHYQGYQGTSTSPAFIDSLNQANATGWTYIGLLSTGSATSLHVTLDDTGSAGTYTAADAIRLTTGSC